MNLQTTWKAGQSSLGAAREAECKAAKRFCEAVATFRSAIMDAHSSTDCPLIKAGLSNLLSYLEDDIHDCGVRPADWAREIERLT